MEVDKDVGCVVVYVFFIDGGINDTIYNHNQVYKNCQYL